MGVQENFRTFINKYKVKFEKIYSTAVSVKRWKEYNKNEKTEYIKNANIYIKWILKILVLLVMMNELN